MNKKAVLIPMFCIGVCLTIYFAIDVILDMRESGQSEEFYTDVADIDKYRPREGRPRPTLTPVTPAPAEPDPDAPEPTPEPEPVWEPYLDFDALTADFPDAVGWLVMDGTIINYPIVQGADNDYYLYRLPDRTHNAAGSIFLDWRVSHKFDGHNTIIYGHHMRAGTMFTPLKEYRKQEHYDKYPYAMIYTPERDIRIELFACYVMDSAREVLPLKFADETEYRRYITAIRRRSVFKSDVVPEFGELLVTFATCEYSSSSRLSRLILVGRIIK